MSIRVWFGGGEVPAHRDVLAKQGVRNLAFNVQPVADSRSGNAGDVDSMEPFYVVFYASQTVNGDAAAVIRKYSDETSIVIGDEYEGALPKVPVWNGEDLEEFYALAVDRGQVFINEADASIENNARPITLFAQRNSHVRIWTTTSTARVLSLPFLTDVIVTGWISAQKHRELQVWDGSKVARSPKASRAKQLGAHDAQIRALGGDVAALTEGDVKANVELAIKSWLQYELVTRVPTAGPPSRVGEGGVALAISAQQPKRRPTKLIPALTEQREEDGTVSIVPSSVPMKQCDTCKIRHLCPEYEAGSTCAFEIPVSIRSKDELRKMISVLLEIQAQRVVEARFFEDVLGEGPTAEAGKEMDRWFQIGEKAKEMTEDSMVITQTVKGSTGMLSTFFGPKVGEAARALPEPIDSDDVLDAVVLGDD